MTVMGIGAAATAGAGAGMGAPVLSLLVGVVSVVSLLFVVVLVLRTSGRAGVVSLDC